MIWLCAVACRMDITSFTTTANAIRIRLKTDCRCFPLTRSPPFALVHSIDATRPGYYDRAVRRIYNMNGTQLQKLRINHGRKSTKRGPSILGTFDSSLGSYRHENGRRGHFFNNRSSLRRSRSTGTGTHSNPGSCRAERQSKPLRASTLHRTNLGSRTRSDDAPSPRASSVL